MEVNTVFWPTPPSPFFYIFYNHPPKTLFNRIITWRIFHISKVIITIIIITIIIITIITIIIIRWVEERAELTTVPEDGDIGDGAVEKTTLRQVSILLGSILTNGFASER